MTQLNDTTVDGTIILDLPATLDADGAVAFIAQMNKLPETGEIRFNAAAVTAVSPGYLQILVSAFKTFPRLSVSDASAEFAEAFARCGVSYPQTASLTAAAAPPPAAAAAADEESAAPMPVAEAPALAPAPEPVTRTILTIDDSRTMRDMLNMALSGAGFTVVSAVDGQDGLNRLAQQPVDLIITDINMPKLDGFGVIRAVRSDPAYDDTPILVLSTEAEQESKDIARDAGATGWIVKPFDPAGLVEIVNSVCG
jgi:two-component system chemotaxis response regulator CheY